MSQRCVYGSRKCCCGLFSLEKGSVIIAIFAQIIAISGFIGHIYIDANPQSTIYGFSFFYNNCQREWICNVLVSVDIVLSVLVNSMLIYGISRERSAYFLPWIIFYVLNLLAIFAASVMMFFSSQLKMLAISLVIFSILVCYSLNVVVSTYQLVYEKENEMISCWFCLWPCFLADSPLSAQENSIEISVITPSAPVTDPRTQYLRSPSLPSYENVVSEQSTKNIETPPPNFDEAVTKFGFYV